MELEELQSLFADPTALRDQIVKTKVTNVDPAVIAAQYDPKKHAIMDPALRPDKTVTTDQGTKVVKVAREPISMQKKIVQQSVNFLCANPPQLVSNPSEQNGEDLVTVIQKTWDDNKMDYVVKDLAEKLFSETEVAFLFYAQPVDKSYWIGTPNEGRPWRLRGMVISPSKSDLLYPVTNKYGDLIAFGRAYSIQLLSGSKEDHFDLYTADKNYFLVKSAAGWDMTEEKNPTGKIPVAYWSQAFPDWWDVEELIERKETLISNLADTNDYFGSPMVFVEGKVTGFAAKGESGKVLTGEAGAKASYLVWQNAPDSVKLEYEYLRSLIFDNSDSIDMASDKIQMMDTLSGIALKFKFMSPHLKAAMHEAVFGMGLQRCLNFIKAAMISLNPGKYDKAVQLSIKPKFEYFLPKNDQELIANLATATGGAPTMSSETAVKMNPYVQDPVTEVAKIKQEGLNNAQTEPPL